MIITFIVVLCDCTYRETDQCVDTADVCVVSSSYGMASVKVEKFSLLTLRSGIIEHCMQEESNV